jgi:FdhE protein
MALPAAECPFCGNEDQKTLGYFFADAENWHAYRIYVCEKCHKYLKAIDSRSAGSKTITLWERIKTRTLEKYVESMGYTPGWKVVVYD